MKNPAFLTHFAIWVAICLGCTAFLLWCNLGGAAETGAAGASPAVRLGLALAAPLLLFGIGAVLGLLVVRCKDIHMGRTGRLACRAVAAAALAPIAVAGIATLLSQDSGGYPAAALVLSYLSMAAPLLIVALGAVLAFGCAPLDEGSAKRS